MTNKHREQSTLLTNTEVVLEMNNQRIPSVGLKETDVAAALQGKAENVREAAADSFRHRSGTVDIAKMDLC